LPDAGASKLSRENGAGFLGDMVLVGKRVREAEAKLSTFFFEGV
jgi:hypothetical protein